MNGEFLITTTTRPASPRSKRWRASGAYAVSRTAGGTAVAGDTGNYLTRTEFNELFETVENDDCEITHIRAKHTLVSVGDVQAFGSAPTGEGGGTSAGGALSLLDRWDGSYDDTYALSAGLGVGLHNDMGEIVARLALVDMWTPYTDDDIIRAASAAYNGQI